MGLGIVAHKRNQIRQAEEFLQKAYELGFDPPKNLGDRLWPFIFIETVVLGTLE